VLVFDEPTTDLDPLGKRECSPRWRRCARGAAILLVEHVTRRRNAPTAWCAMAEGCIVADDTPPALLADVGRPSASACARCDRRLTQARGWRSARRRRAAAAAGGASRARRRHRRDWAPLIEARGSCGTPAPALRDVSVSIASGEFVASSGRTARGRRRRRA
jgi:energy-coupling factor transporter ATP-binding protein EcfA2